MPQKTKRNYYRGKDCMKSFCKDLKEHATKMKKKSDIIQD